MSAFPALGHHRASSAERERAYYAQNARMYRRLASVYELTVFPLRRVRRQVSALAGVTGTSRVLDVATGTGAQARAFAEKAWEVVGVDLSEAMLRVARRKSTAPNLRFEHADATALPFPDGSFDVASISLALHEMPESVRPQVLAELKRVTKPGGAVALVDYGASARTGLARQLVRLYERSPFLDFIHSDLTELTAAAGLELEMDVPLFHSLVHLVVCRTPKAIPAS
jgi:demethylmenaquinone methyltransferase/2-methoxy-6-polyprenyl-1,4-benzoquinol methylase